MSVHYELNHFALPLPTSFIFDAAHISAVSARAGRVPRASKGSQAGLGAKAGTKRTRDASTGPTSGALGAGAGFAPEASSGYDELEEERGSDDDNEASPLTAAAAPLTRQARPVVERVQHVLSVAAYQLDSSAYEYDRSQLDDHASCNRMEPALALKRKMVDRLLVSAAEFESALTIISEDPVLELDVQRIALLALSHRAAAHALELQSISDLQKMLSESNRGSRRRRNNGLVSTT